MVTGFLKMAFTVAALGVGAAVLFGPAGTGAAVVDVTGKVLTGAGNLAAGGIDVVSNALG